MKILPWIICASTCTGPEGLQRLRVHVTSFCLALHHLCYGSWHLTDGWLLNVLANNNRITEFSKPSWPLVGCFHLQYPLVLYHMLAYKPSIGINTGLSTGGSSGGGNQICSSTLGGGKSLCSPPSIHIILWPFFTKKCIARMIQFLDIHSFSR